MNSRKPYVWRGLDDPSRLDTAWVNFGRQSMWAHGTSTTSEYSSSWAIEVAEGWITRRLEVSVVANGWSRHLVLDRSVEGHWSAEAGASGPSSLPAPGIDDPEHYANALDCDLGLCPLTNTMPILRLGLLEHETPETTLTMAWVDVPSLRVIPSGQIYGSSARGTVTYDSETRDFHAELQVDREGIVQVYPSLAERIHLT